MNKNNSKNKIWIDLENSPHVLFFNPIKKELEKSGYQVVVTARDYAQVFDLADLFEIKYEKIGHHFGKNKILKVIGTLTRGLQLSLFAARENPCLAFSHGSRSQLLTAKLCGIPCITALDYEHTFDIPYLTTTFLMMPEVLKGRYKQLNSHKILSYPGIKEDVYVPYFTPDNSIKQKLGITADQLVATVRPPATEAHYHNKESEEIFNEIMTFLLQHEETRIIMLPRTANQALLMKHRYNGNIQSGKIILPENVYNGLDLIWSSDLVLSGGGTMIREAAALNIPAYSFFKGEIGAVDQYLVRDNRLTLIESKSDVASKIILKKYIHNRNGNAKSYSTIRFIVNKVESILQGQKTL